MANEKLKKTQLAVNADSERAKQTGKNQRNANNKYSYEDAQKNIKGTANDIAERARQTGMSKYNSNYRYDLNTMD